MFLQRQRLSDKHRLAFDVESIERRILLAGNVTAELNNAGDLVVRGDAESNQLRIALETVSEMDEVVVTGLDGTTVNNASEFRFAASELTRNVRVVLRGGDDALQIGGEDHDDPTESGDEARLTVPGDLFVNAGVGNDTIRVSFVDIGGRGNVLGQGGDDVVNFGRGPGFGDDHHVNSLGDGPGGGPPADVTVGETLRLVTGAGADEAKVGFAEIGDDLKVCTGTGNDYFVSGRGPIFGGGGNPSEGGGQPADTFVADRITVHTGGGDDFVLLRNTEVTGRARVSTAGGADRLGTENSDFLGPATISAGGGTNIVGLLSSTFGDETTITMGSQEDLFYSDRSDFAGKTTLRLGGGADVAVTAMTRFSDEANVFAQGGDDELQSDNNVYDGEVTLNGGAGTDNSGDDGSSFVSAPTEISIEGNTYDAAIVSMAADDCDAAFDGFLQGMP